MKRISLDVNIRKGQKIWKKSIGCRYSGRKKFEVELEKKNNVFLIKRQNENLKDFWKHKTSVWNCREKNPLRR